MSRRQQLEMLLLSDPGDVFLHYALAMACLSEGETAQGLIGLDWVIQRDPDYVAAYFQKGQALATQGETAGAKSALDRGIAVARKIGDSHAETEMRAFLQELPVIQND